MFEDERAPQAPGWYGKIAILGDFAQRRLPADFVRLSDAWMAQAMQAGQRLLGERWLDVYLNSCVLRFAWAPGVADAHWWFGLLMPSCDNVGRYFPLLIAAARTQPPLDRRALDHLQSWHDHVADAATRTLDEGATIEAFEQALQAAPAWPAPDPCVAIGWQAHGGSERHRLARGLGLDAWLRMLAAEGLRRRFAGRTIWWRQRAGDDTFVHLFGGLPEPAALAEMLHAP
jgi:type VI secretion system protein ImpM